MHDIITIGSALVDIFIHSRQFVLKPMSKGTLICQVYGEKIEVEGFKLESGGGGSNTAIGFAKAGFNVAAVTETGKDTLAELVLADFHKECVSTNYVAQERREETGGSVILVGEDGSRTVMVHRGASSMLDPHDIPMRAIKMTDWVHLSSISGRVRTLQKIAAAITEGRAGLSWNPGQGELELLNKGLIKPEEIPCKVMVVNLEEWRKIRLLQRRFREYVPEIIVTDGERGGKLYLKENRRPITFASGGQKAVDATGAGDAFCVGYVSARLSGKKPQDAIQWGVRNASSVILQFGAKKGLLTRSELSKT